MQCIPARVALPQPLLSTISITSRHVFSSFQLRRVPSVHAVSHSPHFFTMPRYKRSRKRPRSSFNPLRGNLPVALLFFVASVTVFLYQFQSSFRRSQSRPALSFTYSQPRPYIPPALRHTHIRSGVQHHLSQSASHANVAPGYSKKDSSSPHHQVPTSNSASTLLDLLSGGDTNAVAEQQQQQQQQHVIPLSEIPSGPYPFPNLPTVAQDNTSRQAQPGSSWTVTFARGILPSLPLHWISELTHRTIASQDITSGSNSVTTVSSVFRARRKADWIGCRRPHHLVCKGVYRAIKHTNSLSVAATACSMHTGWLPHILRKLREELRPIRLTCLVSKLVEGMEESIRVQYGAVGLSSIIEMDIGKDSFPNGTDMLIVYQATRSGTLIDAMKLFRNTKRSGNVQVLVLESFPDVENMQTTNGSSELRINTGAAPFWFPAPLYEYSNAEENSESTEMEIVAVKVSELFEESETPGMRDLVDPRKRVVQE